MGLIGGTNIKSSSFVFVAFGAERLYDNIVEDGSIRTGSSAG
jgi:hypothetical protein